MNNLQTSSRVNYVLANAAQQMLQPWHRLADLILFNALRHRQHNLKSREKSLPALAGESEGILCVRQHKTSQHSRIAGLSKFELRHIHRAELRSEAFGFVREVLWRQRSFIGTVTNTGSGSCQLPL